MRPRTILGHGRLGIFGILFDWIADGADVPVLGDGDNVYQFVHADDLAGLRSCWLSSGPGPATYNIGAEEFGTMRRRDGPSVRSRRHGVAGAAPAGGADQSRRWSGRPDSD